ncbi:hypothetical protein GCM10010193_12070 [Kitasatospora atroaurantiaca]|uniref:Uncharacterized protein n=1 Tax=Kitasatospora atroaurantiaca TaxID=285545 RepID=A0A561EQP0_9ACTN|nr:hypothetical protein [Kitasatospora atroaurantiaca]TWE17899.1 hypothetical protein FB465_2941 [Kitasatospora atroaurantiaca]
MSYELKALIAATDLLNVVAAEVPVARVARLEQGLALIPMTNRLFDALHESEGLVEAGFESFPGGFGRRLGAWSQAGPIAYVEADYFGGRGVQQAAVWVDGKIDLGPLRTDEDDPRPDEGSPISQALRRLGAQRPYGHDEFEAVGLGRQRSSEGWAVR